mmetsp:Transcript_52224/g.122208  ORF Transcript_52224/g.122208 Transcript_52224/m.122208 type:complete len:339 (-) Transcript_52224:221-1237(-)
MLTAGGRSQVAWVPTPCSSPWQGHAPSAAAAAASARRGEIAQLLVVLDATESNPTQRMIALGGLRLWLAVDAAEPFEDLVELDGLACLRRALLSDNSAVQHDVAWILGNMAAHDFTKAIAGAGIHDAALSVIQSPSRADVCEHCLWLLGNMAADGDIELRDCLLHGGAIGIVSELFKRLPSLDWEASQQKEVVHTMVWMLQQLCAGDPAPQYDEVLPALEFFALALQRCEDVDIVSESCKGIALILQVAPTSEARSRALQQLLPAETGAKMDAKAVNRLVDVLDNLLPSLEGNLRTQVQQLRETCIGSKDMLHNMGEFRVSAICGGTPLQPAAYQFGA